MDHDSPAIRGGRLVEALVEHRARPPWAVLHQLEHLPVVDALGFLFRRVALRRFFARLGEPEGLRDGMLVHHLLEGERAFVHRRRAELHHAMRVELVLERVAREARAVSGLRELVVDVSAHDVDLARGLREHTIEPRRVLAAHRREARREHLARGARGVDRVGAGDQDAIDVLLRRALEEVIEVRLVPDLPMRDLRLVAIDDRGRERRIRTGLRNVVRAAVALRVALRGPRGRVADDGEDLQPLRVGGGHDRVEPPPVVLALRGRLRVEPVEVDAHPLRARQHGDVHPGRRGLVDVEAELLRRRRSARRRHTTEHDRRYHDDTYATKARREPHEAPN